VLAPAGTVHSFKSLTDSARFVVLTTGAGAGNFFRDMDAEIGFPPPTFDDVLRVAARHGVTLAE
jgi:hypothetical protein